MSKRILVTGGFGFIGGHLLELLLRDRGVHVHVVDNLSTSPIPLEVLLLELGQPPNLSYDICTIEDFCRNQARTAEYEEIYHLASPVGPAGILKLAGRMIKTIVDDAYLLMDLAMRSHAKLLDISTSEVYGGGQNGYCSENLPKIVPAKTTVRLEYAIGKLAAETAIINTCQVTSLKASIARPFNVSGPRQSGQGGFVLPRFVSLAMSQKPLTIFGDGQQVRAFTHVKDISDGIVKVMQRGQNGEAYNLGNPQSKISIIDMAKRVVGLIDSHSRIDFVDPKTIYGPLYEEANDKYPDADKAMNELGWNPTQGIDSTIRETYEYMARATPEIFMRLSGEALVDQASQRGQTPIG